MDAGGAGLGQRAQVFFDELQEALTVALAAREGRARFRERRWSQAGGEGTSRILEGGALFERAGVNVSRLAGMLPGSLAARLGVPVQPFRACGISVVVHPLTPLVPATHMNLRHISLEGRNWFGGGADLTPYYLYDEDAVDFHRVLKDACDRHDAAHYPTFKARCDQYFFLAHRGEARGIGGIFFDDLAGDLERTFAFVVEVGRAFEAAYLPIVDRRRDEPWWDRERAWQLVRRGRYVEFNLLQDRGTLFGLEAGGRAEAILMSLPPLVRWASDHAPEAGSREARLVAALARPRDWLGAGS